MKTAYASKKSGLKKKVQYLKGVGPRRAEQVARLGIETVEDLLYFLPRRYEDRREVSAIKDVKPGDVYTIQGKIRRHGIWKSKSGLLIYDMVVSDGSGTIHAVWYNQPYLKKYFKDARDIILHGKVDRFKYLQITHPDYEVLSDEEETLDSVNMGKIVPVYPLTQDVTQKFLRSLIYATIEKNVKEVKEVVPTAIRARQRLADIGFAIKNIHFPYSFDNLKMAYKRLAFEDFFVLETAMAIVKRQIKGDRKGIVHNVEEGTLVAFEETLPFKLTDSQKAAMADIEKDMRSASSMNRLLEGEVASGKTVVAMYALFVTVKNGFCGAVMVPTETLAQQHYATMSEFFTPLGINVRLLIGSTCSEAKESIGNELKQGKIDIIIGTHSLIQEKISFDKIGIIIIDEQHKFGVSQRALLRKKGLKCDVLIMTATPIPRTLALTVYGDLDISQMRELPGEKPPVSTFWVEEERKDKVYKFVKEEVMQSRQAYIVCPRIEETEKSDLKAAKAMYHDLQHNVFPDLKLALIHGRMKGSEKEKLMKNFRANRIQVLVSTVVIEVGIDVSNATVMLIEDADRFGLAQLHQLRGRIGRGEHKSYCILLSNPKNENARRRLQAFEQLQDGFELAEEDLSIRGPGQLFGTMQHGLPEIRFGDILGDKDILELARKEAFKLVEEDSNLSDDRNRNLREVIIERYKNRLGLYKVG